MKIALAAVLLALGACGGEAGGDAPEVTAKVNISEPIGVPSGAGSIWVANFADDAVVRIDRRRSASSPKSRSATAADGGRAVGQT